MRAVNAAANFVLLASHRCAHQLLSLDPEIEPAGPKNVMLKILSAQNVMVPLAQTGSENDAA